ncbi:MAG: GNAT family N-acyltransferase [Rubritalea sp.]
MNSTNTSLAHAKRMMMSDATAPEPAMSAAEGQSDEVALLSPDLATIDEISMLNADHCLSSTEQLAVYLFKGREAPAVMRLIGLARAVTFAAIGAGSGKDLDITDEDDYYDHLLLWDKVEERMVGAYRIGFTEEILKTHGADGLYLNHIFEMKPGFYDQMASPNEGQGAMELSRSFVLPSYQKNPQMLDALWKGIGLAAIARDCYVLYGSVTISASFTPLSQAILVDMLDRYYSADSKLRKSVRAKVPFTAKTNHHGLVVDAWPAQGLNKLNGLIQELEGDHRSIPPLIRYYVSLGAKFLSFQVEESFNNAIYCLLRVDLKALPRRYRKRFLGGAEIEEKGERRKVKG